MSLKKYQEKRNFDKTEEPKGQVLPSSERLHYSLQKHDARALHYDLRLEWKGVLLSWAVPKGPSMNPADKRLAVHVEDHPVDYRTFEGTIPKGEYGGGTVQLFDDGLWQPLMDVDKALAKGELKFLLAGRRLKGQFVLIRLKDKEGDEQKNWLLIKEKDKYALDESGLDEFQTGITSGKTMEEIGESETPEASKKDELPPKKTAVVKKKEMKK